MTGLKTAVCSGYSCFDSVGTVGAMSRVVSRNVGSTAVTTMGNCGAVDTLSAVAPLVGSCVMNRRTVTSSRRRLARKALSCIDDRLCTLGFCRGFSRGVAGAVVDVLTAAFVDTVYDDVSLVKMYISIVPLFICRYADLVRATILIGLRCSFDKECTIEAKVCLKVWGGERVRY